MRIGSRYFCSTDCVLYFVRNLPSMETLRYGEVIASMGCLLRWGACFDEDLCFLGCLSGQTHCLANLAQLGRTPTVHWLVFFSFFFVFGIVVSWRRVPFKEKLHSKIIISYLVGFFPPSSMVKVRGQNSNRNAVK